MYKFLSWDEVRKLSHKGFAIGSHTVTHPILTRCSDVELKWELSTSKQKIEQELSRECPWIAYPNGGPSDFSPEVLSVTEKCGYHVAFVLTEKPNPLPPTSLQMDRLCISNDLSTAGFHARISGLC